MTNRNHSRLVLALLVLAVVTAGCSDKKDDGSRVDVEYGGVSVRATATTGIIRGLVVDQAIRPLANVTVTLTGRDLSTTTSAGGIFGFADLDPGAYFIEASLKDFYTAQAQTTVVAGENEPEIVKVSLTKLESKAPYVQDFKFDVFYVFGSGVMGQSLGTSVTGTNPVTGSPYYFQVGITPNSTVVQTEARWEPSQPMAEGAWVTLLAFDQADEVVESANLFSASPAILRVNGTVGGNTTIMVDYRVYPGMSDGTPAAVFVNQGFTVYMHAFYNFVPRDDWQFGRDGPYPVPPA